MKLYTVSHNWEEQDETPTFATLWQAKRFARKYYHMQEKDAYITVYETVNIHPEENNWKGRLYMKATQWVIFFKDFPFVREMGT